MTLIEMAVEGVDPVVIHYNSHQERRVSISGNFPVQGTLGTNQHRCGSVRKTASVTKGLVVLFRQFPQSERVAVGLPFA
jgi:hypothetical protein